MSHDYTETRGSQERKTEVYRLQVQLCRSACVYRILHVAYVCRKSAELKQKCTKNKKTFFVLLPLAPVSFSPPCATPKKPSYSRSTSYACRNGPETVKSMSNFLTSLENPLKKVVASRVTLLPTLIGEWVIWRVRD